MPGIAVGGALLSVRKYASNSYEQVPCITQANALATAICGHLETCKARGQMMGEGGPWEGNGRSLYPNIGGSH